METYSSTKCEEENRVFFSTIKRTPSVNDNELGLILNTPPNPSFPKTVEINDVCYPSFQPRSIKVFNYTKTSKFKVRTVAHIRKQYEEWFAETLSQDLNKQKKFCLKKIREGSVQDEKYKVIFQKILEGEQPILPSVFRMLSNANVFDKKYCFQKIKIGSKNIRINGSKGSDTECVNCVSSSIATNVSNKAHVKLNTASMTYYKPGPLSRKPELDNSNLGNTDLIKIPEVKLEIYPRIGSTLDKFVLQKLEQIVCSKEVISQEWANFAVSTLSSNVSGNIKQNDENTISFILNYQNGQRVILMRKPTGASEETSQYKFNSGLFKNDTEINIMKKIPDDSLIDNETKFQNDFTNSNTKSENNNERILRKRVSSINYSHDGDIKKLKISYAKNAYINPNIKEKDCYFKQIVINLPRIKIENIEPYCMTHNLYKCFCKNVYTQTFMDFNTNNENKVECSIEEKNPTQCLDNSNKLDLKDEWIKLYTYIPDISHSSDSIQCARHFPFSKCNHSLDFYKERNSKIIAMEKNDRKLMSKLNKIILDAYRSKDNYVAQEKCTGTEAVPIQSTITIEESEEENDLVSNNVLPESKQSQNLDLFKTDILPGNKIQNESNCHEVHSARPKESKKVSVHLETKGSNTSSELISLQSKSQSFKFWLEEEYKYLQQAKVINLGPPILNIPRLFPWEKLVERYHLKKNYVLASINPPYKLFVGVTTELKTCECIPINKLTETQLHLYPFANKILKISQLPNCYVILKGRHDCWEIIGTVTKSPNRNEHEENDLKKTEENKSVKEKVDGSKNNDIAKTLVSDKSFVRIEDIKKGDEFPIKVHKNTEPDKQEDLTRWFWLMIENDFTKLQFYERGFFVKRESILQAIETSIKSGKVIKLSSKKTMKKSDDKFGVYAIPNITSRSVFIGPYTANENLALERVRSVHEDKDKPKTRGMWVTTRIYDLLSQNQLNPFIMDNDCSAIRDEISNLDDNINDSFKVIDLDDAQPLKENSQSDPHIPKFKIIKIVNALDKPGNVLNDTLLKKGIDKQPFKLGLDKMKSDLKSPKSLLTTAEIGNTIESILVSRNFKRIYLESHIKSLGCIEGVLNCNTGQIRFKFPGFKISQAYLPMEAYQKINAILSRKIYIPLLLKIIWKWTFERNCELLDESKLNKNYVLMPSSGLIHRTVFEKLNGLSANIEDKLSESIIVKDSKNMQQITTIKGQSPELLNSPELNKPHKIVMRKITIKDKRQWLANAQGKAKIVESYLPMPINVKDGTKVKEVTAANQNKLIVKSIEDINNGLSMVTSEQTENNISNIVIADVRSLQDDRTVSELWSDNNESENIAASKRDENVGEGENEFATELENQGVTTILGGNNLSDEESQPCCSKTLETYKSDDDVEVEENKSKVFDEYSRTFSINPIEFEKAANAHSESLQDIIQLHISDDSSDEAVFEETVGGDL